MLHHYQSANQPFFLLVRPHRQPISNDVHKFTRQCNQIKMKMACGLAVQASRAFKIVYTEQPLIVLRSAHTQIVREIPAKSFDEIPGPKGLPLLGTFLDYTKDLGGGVRGYQRMHEMQQQRVQQYGPVYREKIFDRQMVTISIRSDGEHLFRNKGKGSQRDPPFPLLFCKISASTVTGVRYLSKTRK